jgi:putative solute:sodium symporter small subunit
MNKHSLQYRRKSLLTMVGLLSAWALVSYGFGILLAGTLDEIHVWGFPLGYWFATQGSIILFVALAFAYCLIMSKLDRSLGLHE